MRRALHRRLLASGVALAVVFGVLSPANALHARTTAEWQGPVHAEVLVSADPVGRSAVLPAPKLLDALVPLVVPRQAGAVDGHCCRVRLRLAHLSPPPPAQPLRRRMIPDDGDRPA